MTSTLTEAPTSCYTVHDVEGLVALPDGTRFRDRDGDRFIVMAGKKRPYRSIDGNDLKFDATDVSYYFPLEILNPEILGNELEEVNLTELLATIALATLAETLLAVLQDQPAGEVDADFDPQVGDRVNVVYGSETWDGPGTLMQVYTFPHGWNYAVKLDHGAVGAFPVDKLEPLVEAVDVKVFDPQVGDRVMIAYGAYTEGRCTTYDGPATITVVGDDNRRWRYVVKDDRRGDTLGFPLEALEPLVEKVAEEPIVGSRVRLDGPNRYTGTDRQAGAEGVIERVTEARGEPYYRVRLDEVDLEVGDPGWGFFASEFVVI